ncbi:MAG TPA: M28 family peptidase, partial [Bryobacteraceae bacterium]
MGIVLMPRRAAAIAALLLASVAPSQPPNPADSIRTDDLRADISFLASDALAGRNAGTPEDLVAAEYIASEFRRIGLKPVGDGGGYFQEMKILTGNVDREHTTLTAKVAGVDHTYTYNQDFRWVRQSLRPMSACGPVVFAGYGVSAPEFGYDDFARIDVKGKVVLALAREPEANNPNSKLMGAWDTYHAFNWHKVEEIRKRGAAGLLLVQDRGPRRDFKPTPASSPRPVGGLDYALAGEMWDLPVFTVTRDVADQLLAPRGKTTDVRQAEIDAAVRPASFDLAESSVCLAKAFVNLQEHPGRNVAGLLEGSDPALQSQAILVTAHHDHMGASNGHIYRGADDDASGVAGLIEIARAFARGGVRPKRSVLFVSYDGEERIFLGSYHYITHPIVPLEKTVANLNMDMIGRDENDANWPVPSDGNVNMVNVLGTRYNPALRKVIDRENERIGLKLDYKMDAVDPDSLWSRSDHFWFATLHIPQVEFQTGLHPDYHTENDTWQRINYPKLTKIVRLV